MKRTAALLLILAMALGLAACGGTPAVSDTTPSQPSTTINEPSTTSRAEQSNTPSTTVENSGGLSKEAQELLDSVNVSNAEASGVCGPDATWYYRNNVLVIKGTGKMLDLTTEDDQPYRDFVDKIQWVVIGDGITSIGDFAFGGNSNTKYDKLAKVYLSDTVETIGHYAFQICPNLTSITIPDHVNSIGSRAFAYCTSLTDITVPDYVTSIGGSAFSGCSCLISITFEGDLSDIPGTNHLQFPDLEIPDGVTIYYHSDTFDPLVSEYPQYNWVKQ